MFNAGLSLAEDDRCWNLQRNFTATPDIYAINRFEAAYGASCYQTWRLCDQCYILYSFGLIVSLLL